MRGEHPQRMRLVQKKEREGRSCRPDLTLIPQGELTVPSLIRRPCWILMWPLIDCLGRGNKGANGVHASGEGRLRDKTNRASVKSRMKWGAEQTHREGEEAELSPLLCFGVTVDFKLTKQKGDVLAFWKVNHESLKNVREFQKISYSCLVRPLFLL